MSLRPPSGVSVDQTGAGDGQVTVSDALKPQDRRRPECRSDQWATGGRRRGALVAGKPTADGLVDISDVLTVLWQMVSPANRTGNSKSMLRW
jgi:hypothetical protein